LLWIIDPIVADFHGASGAHTYCAQHNALEDVRLELPARSPAPGIADAATLHRVHDSCPFASYAQTSTRDTLASNPPRLEKPARPSSPQRRNLRSISVLDSAPKTSPPLRRV